MRCADHRSDADADEPRPHEPHHRRDACHRVAGYDGQVSHRRGPLADASRAGSVDFFDIDPFVQALFDLPAYLGIYCNGDICAADVNCDELINFFDIEPFVTCLFGTCAACP